MSVALDEPSENDDIYLAGDLPFIIEKNLAQKLPELHVDYWSFFLFRGFKVHTADSYRC